MKIQDATNWEEFDAATVNERAEIKRLQDEDGHSHHCAHRIVWGDGECECELYQDGYDPYAWLKNITYTAFLKNCRHMWE